MPCACLFISTAGRCTDILVTREKTQRNCCAHPPPLPRLSLKKPKLRLSTVAMVYAHLNQQMKDMEDRQSSTGPQRRERQGACPCVLAARSIRFLVRLVSRSGSTVVTDGGSGRCVVSPIYVRGLLTLAHHSLMRIPPSRENVSIDERSTLLAARAPRVNGVGWPGKGGHSIPDAMCVLQANNHHTRSADDVTCRKNRHEGARPPSVSRGTPHSLNPEM